MFELACCCWAAFSTMGPNRRAQERERAAPAARAKRAEADRKAQVDAQKIVAIWNVLQVVAAAPCGSIEGVPIWSDRGCNNSRERIELRRACADMATIRAPASC